MCAKDVVALITFAFCLSRFMPGTRQTFTRVVVSWRWMTNARRYWFSCCAASTSIIRIIFPASYASMSIRKRSQRNFFCRVSNFLVSMQMTCSKSGVLWHRVRRSNQVLFCGHTQTSSFSTSTATNQLPPTSISDVKWFFDCSFDVYWKDYWKY